MKNTKPAGQSFLYALGVVAYVAGIAALLSHGEQIFGKLNNFIGPMVFLLLFVISALITGGLVLGRPVYLYFDNKKREGIELFFWTAGWLIAITVAIFVVVAFMR